MRKPSIQRRGAELVAVAKRLRDAGLNWVQVQNAIFGPGGHYSELFPTRQERTAFAKTKQHRQLQKLLGELPQPASRELTQTDQDSGKILVRVPKTVHAALLAEAEQEGTSLNQLILSKLSLQLRAAV
jgi:hypothetical protein